jgi:hypothetical protein
MNKIKIAECFCKHANDFGEMCNVIAKEIDANPFEVSEKILEFEDCNECNVNRASYNDRIVAASLLLPLTNKFVKRAATYKNRLYECPKCYTGDLKTSGSKVHIKINPKTNDWDIIDVKDWGTIFCYGCGYRSSGINEFIRAKKIREKNQPRKLNKKQTLVDKVSDLKYLKDFNKNSLIRVPNRKIFDALFDDVVKEMPNEIIFDTEKKTKWKIEEIVTMGRDREYVLKKIASGNALTYKCVNCGSEYLETKNAIASLKTDILSEKFEVDSVVNYGTLVCTTCNAKGKANSKDFILV